MSGLLGKLSNHGRKWANSTIDEEDSDDFSDSSTGFDVLSDSSAQTRALEDEITKKESVEVLRLRQVVILILIAITLSVSFVIYLVRKKGESEQFNIQYDAAAEKIVESFEEIIHKMGAISGLKVAITTHSVDHGSEWPYVTLSNFQQRAGNALELSGAIYVRIAHLVSRGEFDAWEAYVAGNNNSDWLEESYAYQEILGTNNFESADNIDKSWNGAIDTVDAMHYFDLQGYPVRDDESTNYYLPVWQTSPLLKTSDVNENMMHSDDWSVALEHILRLKSAFLGGMLMAPPGNSSHGNPNTALFASLESIKKVENVAYLGDPMLNIYFPVFNKFDQTARKVVAILTSTVSWRSYFQDILPSSAHGIVVVLKYACGDEDDDHFTFLVDGPDANVIGEGDHHDLQFDQFVRVGSFTKGVVKDGTLNGMTVDSVCAYEIEVYPSQDFYDDYNTKAPIVLAFSIVALFIFMICMFLCYDQLVERRQKVVLQKATQSTAIVSSLFPKNVRDRLMDNGGVDSMRADFGTKFRLKSFMNGDVGPGSQDEEQNSAPIADLFPNCTVFFADIAGFTAWSSQREPSQVFVLLQAVYQAFDAIAKKRRVFKVETIGDCYMAVTGLPEPQELHALIMIRFAFECLRKIHEITKELENTLGPDTGDLSIRVGVHSGPVTAGVLRGDRARFQLFGDTVNTASRMESTGCRGKIQCSEATAMILRKEGKEHWLHAREDMVEAKGKGVLKTYWALPISNLKSTANSSNESNSMCGGSVCGDQMEHTCSKAHQQKPGNERLVNWMTELLLADIRKIVHQRVVCRQRDDRGCSLVYHLPAGKTCMDEVKEIIPMPAFNEKAHLSSVGAGDIYVEQHLVDSLREFVSTVASLYRDNPFHSFEHACHVTMSVTKLLHRIVAPEISPEEVGNDRELAQNLHSYTHGIHSDPLTQFAMTFSALIHDADHRGVSNAQMTKEEPILAEMYHNKSVAEQNSLDMAWELLMEDRFLELRKFIFGTKQELLRFRQIIVNIVLATDIFDAELNDLRKKRWTRAFSGEEKEDSVCSDLRATIVIEHIIQASDVSHTMQHWHVYQRWNKRLLTEMYEAYKAGRMPKNPAEFWYRGELGFFDNYIIPLANKLKECGVFGVSSDEYLNYAKQNRAEWEEKGQEIVAEAMKELKQKDEDAFDDDSIASFADEDRTNVRESMTENAAKIAAILTAETTLDESMRVVDELASSSLHHHVRNTPTRARRTVGLRSSYHFRSSVSPSPGLRSSQHRSSQQRRSSLASSPGLRSSQHRSSQQRLSSLASLLSSPKSQKRTRTKKPRRNSLQNTDCEDAFLDEGVRESVKAYPKKPCHILSSPTSSPKRTRTNKSTRDSPQSTDC